MNDAWVLDASAVLAVLGGEPGADLVKATLNDGAAISSVNLCEVVVALGGDRAPAVEYDSHIGFVQHLGRMGDGDHRTAGR